MRTEGTEGVRAEVRRIRRELCGTEDGDDAEDRTETARSSVEGRRGKEGRGSGGNERRRQGGREHYSVESDELSRLLADGVRESGVEAEASEEAEEFRRSRGWNTR